MAQSSGLRPVGSEAIEGVRFTLTNAAAGTGTLRVKFRKGQRSKPSALSDTYDYYGVPEDAYMELVQTKTPMTYINREIKPRFSYKRFTEEELAAEAAPAPPRATATEPQIDEGAFNAILQHDDDILASSEGRVRVAQALGPLHGDSPSEAMLKAVKSGTPFRFHGLTFSMREGASNTGSNVWVPSIVRRYPGEDAPDAHVSNTYSTEGRATRMLSDKLLAYCRMQNFGGAPEALNQIGDHNIVRIGRHDYFLQQQVMLDLGDRAWMVARVPARGERDLNMQEQVGLGREQRLAGIAFTDRPQAEAYLCSMQMLDDFAYAGKKIERERAKEEEARMEGGLKEYLADHGHDFDISFSGAGDDSPFA